MRQSYGFPEKLCAMIKWCIATIRFSILVNNEIGKCFSSTRGIRQGCPLSPYIFILPSNTFSFLIKNSIHFDYIDGLKLSLSSHVLSHVMFVDNLFIFMRATNEKMVRQRKILSNFYMI